MFFDQMDSVNFLICGFLCVVYFFTNLLLQINYLPTKTLGEDTNRLLFMLNLYALFMSIPLMPFFYSQFAITQFPITIITFFMFSNLIWQLVGVKFYLKKDFSKIIILFSLTNMAAWLMMSFVNYRFYATLGNYFS